MSQLVSKAVAAVVTLGTLYEWARPGGMEATFRWLLQPSPSILPASIVLVVLIWVAVSLNNLAFLRWPLRHPAAEALARRLGHAQYLVPSLSWWQVGGHAGLRTGGFAIAALVLEATLRSIVIH